LKVSQRRRDTPAIQPCAATRVAVTSESLVDGARGNYTSSPSQPSAGSLDSPLKLMFGPSEPRDVWLHVSPDLFLPLAENYSGRILRKVRSKFFTGRQEGGGGGGGTGKIAGTCVACSRRSWNRRNCSGRAPARALDSTQKFSRDICGGIKIYGLATGRERGCTFGGTHSELRGSLHLGNRGNPRRASSRIPSLSFCTASALFWYIRQNTSDALASSPVLLCFRLLF